MVWCNIHMFYINFMHAYNSHTPAAPNRTGETTNPSGVRGVSKDYLIRDGGQSVGEGRQKEDLSQPSANDPSHH